MLRYNFIWEQCNYNSYSASSIRLSTLPYRLDCWSAADMVVLLEGSPLSAEQRWRSVRVTIGFLVTSLTSTSMLRLAEWWFQTLPLRPQC